MAPTHDMRHDMLHLTAPAAIGTLGHPAPARHPARPLLGTAGTDQADTKLAGGAAVLLGGIGLITVQSGGQGEGGAQGVQGRQQGVAVDVLGQDEFGRLMGDQGVFVL